MTLSGHSALSLKTSEIFLFQRLSIHGVAAISLHFPSYHDQSSNITPLQLCIFHYSVCLRLCGGGPKIVISINSNYRNETVTKSSRFIRELCALQAHDVRRYYTVRHLTELRH